MKRILNQDYYEIQELAELLGLKPFTVRKYFHDGIIKGFKLGKTWHATGEALQAFLSNLENRENEEIDERLYQEPVKENSILQTFAKTGNPIDTRLEIAKAAKVSDNTVARVKAIEKAAPPEMKENTVLQISAKPIIPNKEYSTAEAALLMNISEPTLKSYLKPSAKRMTKIKRGKLMFILGSEIIKYKENYPKSRK